MKKAYYYLFYKLYTFGLFVSDDVMNDLKPFITIVVLESLLIIESLVWYTVITRKVITIDNPLSFFLPIVIILSTVNYFFFLHNNKWKIYVEEFRTYDKKSRKIGTIAIFVLIALILTSVVVAFYQLSQIKWEEYR